MEKSLKNILKQSIHIRSRDENKITKPKVGVGMCVNMWMVIG